MEEGIERVPYHAQVVFRNPVQQGNPVLQSPYVPGHPVVLVSGAFAESVVHGDVGLLLERFPGVEDRIGHEVLFLVLPVGHDDMFHLVLLHHRAAAFLCRDMLDMADTLSVPCLDELAEAVAGDYVVGYLALNPGIVIPGVEPFQQCRVFGFVALGIHKAESLAVHHVLFEFG